MVCNAAYKKYDCCVIPLMQNWDIGKGKGDPRQAEVAQGVPVG
jgi:hypothetical protein